MTLFAEKAPWIMNLLRADFGLTVEEAAAVLGNIGHECGGFLLFQEQKPLVPGSKGGFGWCQWTGPRRRSFEAYCARNNLDPKSDRANYGFLFVELKGSEKKAIPAVKKAVGLHPKVKAFELAFERAGVKHYPSRYTWADRAMIAWRDNSDAEPPYKINDTPKPVEPPAPPPPDDPGSVASPDESVPAFWTQPIVWIIAGLAVFAGLKAAGVF